MSQTVYVDTSVVGGMFDEEFDDSTKNFFKILNVQNVTILVSEIIELEIYKAPENIIELFEGEHRTG